MSDRHDRGLNAEYLPPSPANPLGRQWHELDNQGRIDVLKENINGLQRGSQGAGAAIDPTFARAGESATAYEDRHGLKHPWDREKAAFDASVNMALERSAAAGGSGISAVEDPASAERRALKELHSVFETLVACPSRTAGEEFVKAADAYQNAWMRGRKRVTISE